MEEFIFRDFFFGTKKRVPISHLSRKSDQCAVFSTVPDDIYKETLGKKQYLFLKGHSEKLSAFPRKIK